MKVGVRTLLPGGAGLYFCVLPSGAYQISTDSQPRLKGLLTAGAKGAASVRRDKELKGSQEPQHTGQGGEFFTHLQHGLLGPVPPFHSTDFSVGKG